MARSLVILIALACSLAASSCSSGGGSGGGGAAAVPANVAGAWSGVWNSNGGQSGGATMVLSQTGTTASGNGSLTGSVCIFGQDVSGRLNGNHFTGAFTSQTTAVTFNVVISGPTQNQLNGTYLTTMGGICTGDTGTISMQKQ